MLDYYNNEMKNLNESAYPWMDQTVEQRIDCCIRLLRCHGIITTSSALKAFERLNTIKKKAIVTELRGE